MGLYEQLEAQPGGRRKLAAARLRERILGLLHSALRNSGMTQAELAEALNVRRSAVNQVFRGEGNLRVNTIAEYLDTLGYELRVEVVPAGTARERIRERTLSSESIEPFEQNARLEQMRARLTFLYEFPGEAIKSRTQSSLKVSDSKRSDFSLTA